MVAGIPKFENIQMIEKLPKTPNSQHIHSLALTHTQPIKKITRTEHIYQTSVLLRLPALICFPFQSHIFPTSPTMPIAVLHTQP